MQHSTPGASHSSPGRGEATRERIRASAREQFARLGYERTTIRAVASAADIDPSMVMRYFGSKEGLFAAAAPIDLEFPTLPDGTRGAAGQRLVEHFFTRWEDDAALVALLRRAMTDEQAAEALHGLLVQQVAPAIAELCPLGADPASRAGLVATQMLGVATCRYLLRLPPVVGMDVTELVAWLGPTVQRYVVDERP
ncbi:TetR/AcrR family transcriptional regulator [Kytococcus schroeteri]|uniref:TetR/AcrR family transcriptional regulator n=1 Tax=Kytococcus schroeteri TaxID=138300 RepID=UPI00114275E8|nr:TetR family transcriptional regulator [Kytococcus schroeteri]